MFEEYIELIPILCVGLISGLVGFLDSAECNKEALLKGIKKCVISSFVCVVTFTILSSVDNLPYLTIVGISATVGFLGFDRAIQLVKDILSIRKV